MLKVNRNMYEKKNYIMKSSARFMMSWFGMTMIKRKIVLHQCIVCTDTLGENDSKQYMLRGKQSTIVESKKVAEIFFI